MLGSVFGPSNGLLIMEVRVMLDDEVVDADVFLFLALGRHNVLTMWP